MKWTLIITGIIAGLYVVARLTFMIQWFTAPTISNHPTIKSGDIFFASKLVTPKRFNFICYRVENETDNHIWVHRLCGVEGDKIQIQQGDLFVNDQFVDSNFSVAHNYILPYQEIEKLQDLEPIDEESIQNFSRDSSMTYLSRKTIIAHDIKARRLVLPEGEPDEYISHIYSKPWNQDNFGPIVVPQGKYFVLGDNRMNSQDSRYLGFIDKSKFVATVIGR